MAFTLFAPYLFLRFILLLHICREQICVNPFLDQGLEPSWKAIKRKTGEIGRASKFPVPPPLQTPHTQPTPISAFLSFTTKTAERFSKWVADQWCEVWWLREPSPQKVLGFFFFLFSFFFLAGERGWELKPTTTTSSLQAPPFLQQSA